MDSAEDSGFESQTKQKPSRPLQDAVGEWLKGTNSSEIFITSYPESSESEDEELEETEQPKNLQGNPMPALSVNVDNDKRSTGLSKFAKANHHGDSEKASRKKRNQKSNKKKSIQQNAKKSSQTNSLESDRCKLKKRI